MIDVAIVGGGPAALTAAIYTARVNLKTVVFERGAFGGTLTQIAHISNYPGFLGRGQDLADSLKEQTKQAGATLEYGEITEIKKEADKFILTIDGEQVEARSVIVATGSESRKLNLKTNKPVSYCVMCDAPLHKDKDILVIGGGNSAIQESLHLVDIAKTVTVMNRSKLRAEASLVDSLKSHPNVTINEDVDFSRIDEIADNYDAIFVLIGKTPATSFIAQDLLDENEFIITNAGNMSNLPGLFAAGDVRSGSMKQAITAAADGAIAAKSAIEYLKTV